MFRLLKMYGNYFNSKNCNDEIFKLLNPTGISNTPKLPCCLIVQLKWKGWAFLLNLEKIWNSNFSSNDFYGTDKMNLAKYRRILAYDLTDTWNPIRSQIRFLLVGKSLKFLKLPNKWRKILENSWWCKHSEMKSKRIDPFVM